MKIPLRVPRHSCKEEELIFIDLSDLSFERKCSCGDVYSGFFGNDVTVGYKILFRSRYELIEAEDYPLSIVFSATAFECELARLYFKWSDITALQSGKRVSDGELEEVLRKYKSIDVRVEEVCKLMDPLGFQEFVESSTELRQTVTGGFPSLHLNSFTSDFQQKLFWPRNRILHLADTSFKKADAVRCFNIATLGLRILEELDEKKAMPASHSIHPIAEKTGSLRVCNFWEIKEAT